jgi:pyruvate/2-oxoglutarate dehydrogenase complex dihydrolipoamide dehydrogenase (E3) component
MGYVPVSAEKLESGKFKIGYKPTNGEEVKYEEFDNILVATGRYADIQKLGLEDVGVKFNQKIHASSSD